MNAEHQLTTGTVLAALRRKLGHLNRAIAELERLEATETLANADHTCTDFANVVSIDRFRRGNLDATKATQRPPATSLRG